MDRSLIQGGPTKLFVSHSVIEVKKVRLSSTGLYGSRMLRLLEFLDSRAYEGGERVSAVRTRQTDGHDEANSFSRIFGAGSRAPKTWQPPPPPGGQHVRFCRVLQGSRSAAFCPYVDGTNLFADSSNPLRRHEAN